MGKTSIEWTRGDDGTAGESWNPVAGCSIVSPGCTNCYAMRMAGRLRSMGLPHYASLTQSSKAGAVWTGEVALAPERVLLAPLSWKKPRRVFVNSMSDLFHESIPDEWIDRTFAVMALCQQHVFQILTKRADRMREYMAYIEREAKWMTAVADLFEANPDLMNRPYPIMCRRDPWLPLPNVWLGISAERQQEWDERKEHLCTTPAAIHFASFEPLIGPIIEPQLMSYFIQWSIVGGESGSGARGMKPEWARSLRDQCKNAGVPFFYKQTGEWIDADVFACRSEGETPLNYEQSARLAGKRKYEHHSDGSTLIRFGKKAAGRLLDGREHNDMPKAVAV